MSLLIKKNCKYIEYITIKNKNLKNYYYYFFFQIKKGPWGGGRVRTGLQATPKGSWGGRVQPTAPSGVARGPP